MNEPEAGFLGAPVETDLTRIDAQVDERLGPITMLQVDAHLDYRDEVDGVREDYSSPRETWTSPSFTILFV